MSRTALRDDLRDVAAEAIGGDEVTRTCPRCGAKIQNKCFNCDKK